MRWLEPTLRTQKQEKKKRFKKGQMPLGPTLVEKLLNSEYFKDQ